MSDVISVKVVADTSTAQQQINTLKQSLQNIAAKPIDINNQSLLDANRAAIELQKNLQAAVNVNTGKLDLSVFDSQMRKSNQDLLSYANHLNTFGKEGRDAFRQLASSISQSDLPITRLNAKLLKFGQTIKNTINWQISSSLIHGVMGAFSSAIGYAKDLNESLNNIRIVTGQSVDQMARFAVQANKAAKSLSTTTTRYTDAALIYYQQGLDDTQVKARTDVTVKLANAAGISAQAASDQLTAIWNNFDNGTKSLEHYADVLVKLGAETASSSDEISQGMEKFAAIAQTVGLSYEYAASALATVTATTRQSADTVGTAFKTLFARLEGLQLGDTLEDGTDLNKYSSALAAVGISIKDVSGDIKDMDTILDELGARWQTLAKDQQIALAQTVGGMRQYNQLIALMDNWDFFQENLNRSQNADGALNQQAAIYAESWEAASARLKASLEDVFDSLISDKAIINFTNGLAKVTDVVADLVDGLGGLKGMLLLISSIFMKNYSKQIPGVMQNLGYTFNTMFRPKAAAQQAQKIQAQATQGLKQMYGKATSEKERAQIQTAIDDATINAKYLANSNRMSDREKAAYRQYQANRALQNKAREESAAQVDKNKAAIDTEREELFSQDIALNQNGLRDLYNRRNTVSGQKTWNETTRKMSKPYEDAIRNSVQKSKTVEDIQIAQSGLDEIKNASPSSPIERAKKISEAIQDIADKKIEDLEKKLKEDTKEGTSDDDIETAVKNFEKAVNDHIQEKLKKAEEGLETATNKETQAREDFARNIGENRDDPDGAVNTFREAVETDERYRIDLGRQQPEDIIDPETGDLKNKFGNIATSILSLSTIYTSAASAVQIFADNTSSAGDIIGALVSSFGAIAVSGSQIADSLTNLVGENGKIFGVLSTGMAGLIISVATAVIGGLVAAYEKSIQDKIDQANQTIEEQDKKQQLAEENKKLTDSVIDAYTSLKTLENSGRSTAEALVALRDAASNMAEKYDSDEMKIALASGDANRIQQAARNARDKEITDQLGSLGISQIAEESLILNEVKQTKAADWGFMFSGIDSSFKLQSDSANGIINEASQERYNQLSSFLNDQYDNSILNKHNFDLRGLQGTFNVDELSQLYDEIQSSMKFLQSSFGPEAANMEIYQNLSNWLGKIGPSIEEYKKNEEDITKLKIEQKALDQDNLYDVDSLETYIDERQKLIKSIKAENQEKGLGYKITEEQTDAVDAYLGTLSTTAAYTQKMEGIKSLADIIYGNQDNKNITPEVIQGSLISQLNSFVNQMKEAGYNEMAAIEVWFDVRANYTNDIAVGTDQIIEEAKAKLEAKIFELDVNLLINLVPTVQDGTIAEITRYLEGMSKELQNMLKLQLGLSLDTSLENLALNLKGRSEGALTNDVNAVEGQYNTTQERRQNYQAQLKSEEATRDAQEQVVSDTATAWNARRGNEKENSYGILPTEYRAYNADGTKSTVSTNEFSSMDQLYALLGKYDELYGKGDSRTEEESIAMQNTRNQIDDILSTSEDNVAKAVFGTNGELDTNNALVQDAEAYNAYIEAVEAQAETQGKIDELNSKIADENESGELEDFSRLIENHQELFNEFADNGGNIADLQNLGLNEEMLQMMEDYDISLEDVLNNSELFLDQWKKVQEEMFDGETIDGEMYNGEWEEASEQAAILAAQQKKLNEDLKEGREAYDEWNDVLSDSNASAEDQNEALLEVAESIGKILNVKKVSKEFAKFAHESGLLKKALTGDRKALMDLNKEFTKNSFKQLAKDMGKTIDVSDGVAGAFDDLQELFGKDLIPDSLVSDAENKMSQIKTAMEDLKPGDALSEEATKNVNQMMTDMITAIYSQTGNLDEAVNTAYAAMRGEGIEPPELEEVEFEGTETTIPGYIEHGVRAIPNIDVVAPSVKVTPTDVPIPATTIPAKKIKAIQFKDAPATMSNGGKKSSGGGGGGGGGAKPKPPKPLKRIDPKVRYEGTQKRIDNLKKKQDQIEEKKEAAFGKEKIKQAEKEIELKQRQIKLQTQYMEETKEALDLQKIDVSDRLSKITNVEIEFDVDGSVKNLDKIEEAILNIENHIINLENAGADEFEIAAWQEKLDMAREGFDDLLQIIEDTMEAENDFFTALNELAELNLELVQIKVDLDISLAEADLEYIDYLLEKLTDEGFEAAEAITVLGDKANNALGQIETYRKGIAEILANRGLSVDDLMNMDADDLIGLGFTQAEIDALLEYRSAIIENMSTLNELRAEMIDKVSTAFGAFSDELSRQIDLFEHYSGLLEHFGEIATLTGSRFAKSELRDLFNSIDNAAMANGQANIRAAKSNLEDLRSMYEAYMTSYAEAKKQAGLGENDTIFEYEETRKEMEDALREAEETFYSTWEDTLSKATDILERWVEDAGARFEEVLSPMYQSLDRLEEAYDRMKEQDENYYDNYEQLYHLSQLTRDISNSIDDTDSIKGKQRLRDLMKEITDIQARGVELSEYDVDVLRKRYELEQARQALEDASDNASLVRLQRDQEGNWGYVYTADEDAVDEAEKEYENKLYELQKANDEYIKELQDRILELTTNCKEQLADIAADTTLSPEEKERLSKEISDFYNSQLEYLTSQMDGALANQNATLGLMLSIYDTTKDQLLDTWEETNLSLLGMYNNTGDMFAGLTGAMKGYIEDLWEGIENFDNNLNNTNIAAGSADAFGTLAEEIGKIGENTEETEQAVESLGDTFVSEFETIMTEVTRFEEVWGTQIDSAIDKNEEFVSSLLEVISLLALVNTDDKEFTDAYNEYKAAQQKYLESLDGTISPSTIRYGLVETNDPEWEAAKRKFEEFMTQWMAKHSGGIMDSGEAFDTGGYTGEWGPEGRLAWLHQKELILNPVDTENLLDAVAMVKTLELNVGAFTDRLSEVIPSMMTMERGAFQQEIYITAEFTEATSAAEIQEAFENLINDATQYAYSR